MDISSYLKVLLKTQKEVGVAGLGTFLKKKVAGSYDSESHSFIAPRYLLNFTRDVAEDTLLRDYICKKRNISAESAVYFINGFAEDINAQIDQNNKAILGELGIITKYNNEWVIENVDKDSSDFGFYGLPAVAESIAEETTEVKEEIEHPSEEEEDKSEVADQLIEEEPQHSSETETSIPESPIQHTTTEEKTTRENDNQFVFEEISEQPSVEYSPPVEEEPVETVKLHAEQPAVIETTETLEVIETPKTASLEEDVDETVIDESGAANIWHFDGANSSTKNVSSEEISESINKGMATWVKVLIGLFILVIAVVALYVLKPSVFQVAPTKTPKTKVVKTAPPVAKPIVVDTISKKDTVKISAPAIDTLKSKVPVDSATTWEIIGASLTKKEVKQYIADMKFRGITAKAIPTMPGKRTKMSIATFPDEQSAKEGRKALIKKLKDEDLYIYQNKHTYKPL